MLATPAQFLLSFLAMVVKESLLQIQKHELYPRKYSEINCTPIKAIAAVRAQEELKLDFKKSEVWSVNIEWSTNVD